MVTVLLLNYKRPQNLSLILDSLTSQSVKCNIFLWNNASEPYHDPRIDLTINASQNLQCWPRWGMASYADTPYVMTHDDDLLLNTDDCLEKLIAAYERNKKNGLAIGFNGVKLDAKGKYYPSSSQKNLKKIGIKHGPQHIKFPRREEWVDIVKGRLIFCAKDDLMNIPLFVGRDGNMSDDIVVSSFLSNGKRGHHLITPDLNGKITELPEGKNETALSQSATWEQFRNTISKKYFK